MKEEGIRTLEKLFRFINECRKEKPEVTDDMLCDNGAVFYKNAKNGTDFDWNENGKTSPFVLFFKSTEMGFVKVCICDDGDALGYIYDEAHSFGDEPIVKKIHNYVSKEEASSFSKWLLHNFDEQGRFDVIVKKNNSID